MLAQTSLLAYRQIKRLDGKRKIVYDVISRHQPITNDQIASILEWEINRVTGRVSELCKMGYVGTEGRGMTKSGNPAKLWSTRDPNDRKLLEQDCEE